MASRRSFSYDEPCPRLFRRKCSEKSSVLSCSGARRRVEAAQQLLEPRLDQARSARRLAELLKFSPGLAFELNHSPSSDASPLVTLALERFRRLGEACLETLMPRRRRRAQALRKKLRLDARRPLPRGRARAQRRAAPSRLDFTRAANCWQASPVGCRRALDGSSPLPISAFHLFEAGADSLARPRLLAAMRSSQLALAAAQPFRRAKRAGDQFRVACRLRCVRPRALVEVLSSSARRL